MAQLKVYGKEGIKEIAKRIIHTGKEILAADENGILFVTTNPDLVDAISYFELEDRVFFIGHRK